MSEKEPRTDNSSEKKANIEQFGGIAHERREAMRNALERGERMHQERESEREIVAKAIELANESNQINKESHKASPAKRRTGPINKKQLDTSFKSQMKFVEDELSGSEKLFSRVIHNKAVEKTSDFLGSTIARPNAMLSGSIFAFIGVTLLYFLSKYYGFQLSGFETIGAFLLGWIVGIAYDYLSIMIRGNRRHDK